MTETLRTGIIGTGGWGTHIAEQFHNAPNAEVVAITDVSEQNLERAGEKLAVDLDHQYDDYEAMLASEELDAVQVTSPHTLHYEHITDALDRGLHVFCEKPLVPGVDRAKDLVRRSEESEQVLMVGYQRHVHQAYVDAREAIAEGDDPKFVTAELTQNWIEAVDGTWRVDPDLSGGGQLYDSGNHLLDAVFWITGLTPAYVSAEMEFFDDERRVDVQATLNVGFEDGTVAGISVSGDSPEVYEQIHVSTDRTVAIEGKGWTPRTMTITNADGEELAETDADVTSMEKVSAFVEAALSGETPPATARHALYATAVTEAAYESARTGERVDVDLDL